jgi:heme-binding NEAT domain protein
VLEHPLLFNVLKHPLAALIILMATTNTEQAAVISDDRAAELRDVGFEVDEILGLLESNHIVKVDIFVAPLEVMDDSFISQFFLDNEQILEKFNDPLVDVKMVKFGYHRLLIF